MAFSLPYSPSCPPARRRRMRAALQPAGYKTAYQRGQRREEQEYQLQEANHAFGRDCRVHMRVWRKGLTMFDSLLKMGTGSELGRVLDANSALSRRACPLFHQAVNRQGGGPLFEL